MRERVQNAVVALVFFAALKVGAGEAAFLIDNFTTPLPDSASVSCSVEVAQPKIGLGSAIVQYRLDEKQRRATLNFQQESARTIPGPGMLKLWVKGDGSGTEIEFMLRHAKTRVENDGRRVFFEHGQQNFPRVKMDFSDWREITLDGRNLPKDKVIWWDRVDFHGQRPDPKNNPEPKMEGTLGFDDFRLIPVGDKPGAAFQCGLIGDAVRSLSKEIAYFADVRNFTGKPARARARISLTDRNGNKIAERDFPLEVDAGAAREFKLELEPENLEGYLPPFVLSGDVLSTDLPEVSATIEQPLTMGNAALLIEDFSNVNGRWFTAGYQHQPVQNQRQWMEWLHGEGQRNSTLFQSSAAISRVAMESGNAANLPSVRHAMQVDFNGEAIVYNGADRYLPGQAYRVGFWVKGDGSGAKLSAVLLDFTNGADFWAGGWKRTHQGELPLCVLDFKEWRFIEVDLPGRGQGSMTARGSTDGIDFPFELTAFRIQPVETAKTGSVQFGPVIAKTQVAAVSTLALQIGYDDADFNFDGKKNGWVTVQNGWPFAARKVKAQWTLLDRSNEKIGSGQLEAELPAGALKVLPMELAKLGEICEKKTGPFKLEVTVSDSTDPSVSTSRQVMIAKPDSDALLADFETERGFYGWKEGPLWTAQTSSEQAQAGKRALKIGWNKAANPSVTASIDPAVPGAAVDVTMQVFGDESGAIFYPVLGGAPGVNHGGNQTNFFLLRRVDAAAGELQNGVRLNWRGWKSFTFRLPQIPTNWDQQGKVLPFIPTYPTGLHLVVDSRDAVAATGAVFVDEIRVKTHVDSAARVALALERGIESNVNADGTVTLRVANHDRVAARKVDVACGIYNWRNVKVAALDVAVDLKPGETKRISTQEKLPPGSYSIKAELKENGATLASLEDDLLAADLSKTLGAEWLGAVNDEWKLRAPLQDAFAYIDEDWDWVEHHPGNLQMDTIRERTRRAAERGGDPYVLLGFGAYWSAGIGFDQMKAGAFQRRQRDIGHAVDIFMVPQRMEDWENYVSELMRGAEGDVRGWVIWDNPDSAGPMKVEPAQFAQMLHAADKWRRVYCPKVPLVVGGMSRATAVPYLKQLSEQSIGKDGTKGLDTLTGVQVRLDVGRLSPEDAEVRGYVAELKSVLNSGRDKNKTVLLSDLDWAVEKDAAGLTAFDQAAYLSRSAFLLDEAGIKPLLSIRNEDSVRLGLGLVHRRKVTAPPMTEMVQAHDFKPAWWAMVQTRRALSEMKFVANIEVADVVEQRTLAKLYSRGENACSVAVWRNDDAGEVSFASTGLSVASAQDVLASPVAAKDGWFAVGKMPTIFALNVPAGKAAAELRRLWVRDGAEAVWAQRVIAAFSPESGEAFERSVRTLNSETIAVRGVKFASGGKETLKFKADASADVVLRKTFVLDETGQDAEVRVNGKSAGRWNLKRTEAQLSSGLRSACFVIGKELLQGGSEAAVELVYATPANTVGWTVLEYKGGAFPLSAWGPVHADQNFGHARFARNVTGSRLKIGTQEYSNGVGVFAQSLQEFSLNKQFKRFKAQAGVDAITEGKGSVVFEVYADGRKVWTSGTVSGLDKPKEIDLDVSGVERLRLVVTDAGDGNKFDAGNWCEAELVR